MAKPENMTKGQEDEGLMMRKESEFLSEEKRLSARMDIYAPCGTKVRVVQKSHDGFFPNIGVLEMGAIYTVEKTDVHDWYTHVFLEEFSGLEFNSVCFENAGEKAINCENEPLTVEFWAAVRDSGNGEYIKWNDICDTREDAEDWVKLYSLEAPGPVPYLRIAKFRAVEVGDDD